MRENFRLRDKRITFPGQPLTESEIPTEAKAETVDRVTASCDNLFISQNAHENSHISNDVKNEEDDFQKTKETNVVIDNMSETSSSTSYQTQFASTLAKFDSQPRTRFIPVCGVRGVR